MDKILHRFHILPPSFLPIINSVTAIMLCIVLALSFQGQTTRYEFFFTIVLLILGVIFWFNTVTWESNNKAEQTLLTKQGITRGFVLFILSEIMIFFSLFCNIPLITPPLVLPSLYMVFY